MAFEAFGVTLELGLEGELESKIIDILPPGWHLVQKASPAARFALREVAPGTYSVTADDIPAAEHVALELALDVLDARMRMVIAAHAPDWIFVHAGVVAVDGRAMLIPGESFSGKTTLVAALIAAGATYYSDEYAVLDKEGLVHPYPRPLSLRDGDSAGSREMPAEELGQRAFDETAEVRLVVMTRYRPGASWEPKELTRAQGLLALLANTVPAQERPRDSLRALSRATAHAKMVQTDRGEASTVAPRLLAALSALTPSTGTTAA